MSTFPHDDPDFGRLVVDVAGRRGIDAGLVEKDYWITHVLWALHASGIEVRFKGGTCLSKGYGLIERFSEDLDLQLEPGTSGLPPPPNWRGDKPSHIARRQAWFGGLESRLSIPGCHVELNHELDDERARSAVYEVHYPGGFAGRLGPLVSPWVRLEVGVARTTPALLRPISSWVHDEIDARAVWAGLVDNRPPPVHCVRPMFWGARVALDEAGARVRRWVLANLALPG